MSEYLKAFIIGSSWPTFILYFYAVSNYSETERKYSYRDYTFVAPLFLGLLNMFGLYLANKFNLSRGQRFILSGLVGAMMVSIIITLFNVYNYDSVNRWVQQYISLFIVYLVVFGIVVNLVDYLI